MRMSRTGVTPRTAKLFFAGTTHAGQIRVCQLIHMTLKTPLLLFSMGRQLLTLYSRRRNRDISDIPPRHPNFTKISFKNTAYK
jgi:hypothetical protein